MCTCAALTRCRNAAAADMLHTAMVAIRLRTTIQRNNGFCTIRGFTFKGFFVAVPGREPESRFSGKPLGFIA